MYAWLEVVFARPIFSKIKGVNIMELSTFFKKGIFRHFLALVLAVTGSFLLLGPVSETRAGDNPMYQAQFDSAGKLIRPAGWREWVFVGSPTTPNSLNGGAAPFPEFH